jgi:hypothetical protein
MDDKAPVGDVFPWFADRAGVIPLYRINRRPLPQPTLFSREPESFVDHLLQTLPFGESVETEGGGVRREWHLGNRDVRPDLAAIFGQVGWIRTDLRTSDRYNLAEQRWEDAIEDSEMSARAPFVIDTRSRFLGVLQHKSFRHRTVAGIFQTLLRGSEQSRPDASTEWSVEPVLDPDEFSDWLSRVDAVERLRLVAKLPNPDALSDFEPVWHRMQALRAKVLRESMDAVDPNLGLGDLTEDEQVKAFLAMGKNAFGYVVAKGHRGDRNTTFDQRENVAREHTGPLPRRWSDVFHTILGVMRGRR